MSGLGPCFRRRNSWGYTCRLSDCSDTFFSAYLGFSRHAQILLFSITFYEFSGWVFQNVLLRNVGFHSADRGMDQKRLLLDYGVLFLRDVVGFLFRERYKNFVKVCWGFVCKV
uniref:Uncharacterized protein n=1 Tax=Cacopsylla melanoneura TaxID=428564 RepID=A0A8D9F2W5_9HEMI